MGQLARGTPLRLEGTVVAAGPTLRAKLGGEECVYWDVRGGLDAGPPEVEARPFWLELVGGERVLVPIEHLAVRLRGDVERDLEERVEKDIEAVSKRLGALKDRSREGTITSAERGEQKRLRKVATLLCAIRAEHNGNVHIGGNPVGQRRWIAKNRYLADGIEAEVTVQRFTERTEHVLAPGDRIRVEGMLQEQALPPEIGGAGGYRSLATGLVVVPSARGRKVRLTGLGELAPRAPEPATPPVAPLPASVDFRVPTDERRKLLAFVITMALTVAVAYAFSR